MMALLQSSRNLVLYRSASAGLAVILLASLATRGQGEEPAPTPVGAASIDITPDYPVRLTGYGNRKVESEGVAQRLWAKALAIGGDEEPGPAILITVENCGMTPTIAETVAARLEKATGLPRERLAIAVSHTHTGPSLPGWAPYIFGADFPPDQLARMEKYASELTDKMERVARDALAKRQPAYLFRGKGKVTFAVNRRVLKEGKWTGFGIQPDGPVDHGLPVLVARDAQGKPLAVWANYACHCTTLGGDVNQIAGDWSGYAQEYLEKEYPGAVALISIGCGADANPEPRDSKQETCQKHARQLTDEVKRVLAGQLKPVSPQLSCRFTHLELPFGPLPSEEEWQEKAKQPGAPGYHAKKYLERLQRGEKIPTTLSYPIGTWCFGDDLAMVFLGGEVVVDYAIRMSQEFDADRLWVNAYSNDVVCYIPSQRILREGGYESDFSMIYYARPTRFAPEVEDLIIDGVQKLLPQKFYSPAKQADFPPPKTPQEAIASMRVPAGWQVELLASEPLIEDPVAFDWGPDGRLWVVEMRDYPNGMAWNGQGDPLNVPGGRVRCLTDSDGDGRYDQATTFLDGLPFPNGIKVWREGVLITSAPHVIYAEDTDGDGKADRRENWFTGFVEGNQQHRVNGMRWGLDNWLYLANGDSGGRIKFWKGGEEISMSGRDVRLRPDEGLIDPQAGPTQFGRCRDAWGSWFGGNNANPLWHYTLEDHYLRRNPQLAPPEIRRHVSIQPGAAPVFPASRVLARFNDFHTASRFTSACAPEIYGDDLISWPGPADAAQVFICEPVHNLVHREVMTPTGTTFTSRRADEESASEFLASDDNWFRPVMIRTAPDGTLWVADMYRSVIEHPEWIPQIWQRKLDLRAGSKLGRIYRISHANHPPREFPRLDRLDVPQLVASLESPNSWQRDMVQQMLIWRGDKSAGPLLRDMAIKGRRATARLHALCTLDGLGLLDRELIMASLSDAHPGVRRHAVRLSERFLGDAREGDPLVAALDRLLDDADPQVRLQLGYSWGAWPVAASGERLGKLAVRAADDPYTTTAVFSSLTNKNLPDVLTAILHETRDTPPAGDLLGRFLLIAAAMGDRTINEQALSHLLEARDEPLSSWRFAALGNLLEAWQRRGGKSRLSLDQLVGAAQQAELMKVLERARAAAANSEAPEADRIQAVRLVGLNPQPTSHDVELFRDLLVPQNPPALQQEAIAMLGRSSSDRAASELLASWRALSPALRSSVLDTVMSRPASVRKFLEAIEQGEIPVSQIDARRRQQLAIHPDADLRHRARAIFEKEQGTPRAQVVAQFQDVLQLSSDAARGKTVFSKRCAVCHRLENVGHAVGPDLAALTDRSPATLLTAILDPNRAVEDKFLDYLAVGQDGRQFTGMLTEESGTSVTLTGQEAKQITLLRSELETLQSSGKSLMPEGLEKDVSRQDLADVLAYLRGFALPPKSFPGNHPEVAHVRDDGSIHLLAMNARIYGPSLVFEEHYRNLGYWSNPEDHAIWDIQVPRAGKYQVVIDYACPTEAAGNRFALSVSNQSLGGVVASTESWDQYRSLRAGVVDLPAGPTEVLVRSDGQIRSALMDLRSIRLQPLGN